MPAEVVERVNKMARRTQLQREISFFYRDGLTIVPSLADEDHVEIAGVSDDNDPDNEDDDDETYHPDTDDDSNDSSEDENDSDDDDIDDDSTNEPSDDVSNEHNADSIAYGTATSQPLLAHIHT